MNRSRCLAAGAICPAAGFGSRDATSLQVNLLQMTDLHPIHIHSDFGNRTERQ